MTEQQIQEEAIKNVVDYIDGLEDTEFYDPGEVLATIRRKLSEYPSAEAVGRQEELWEDALRKAPMPYGYITVDTINYLKSKYSLTKK